MHESSQPDKDFSNLYVNYYPKLIRFARDYVLLEEDAENIVQDVFMRLWEKRESLEFILNTNAYLFRLIKNRCLDYVKHQLSVDKHNKTVQSDYELELALKLQSLDRFNDNLISDEDIENLLSEAINSLPEKCREIFVLSRIDGMKYKEISERLDVSINTVENQMSIALNKLRVKLKNYLPLLIFLFS